MKQRGRKSASSLTIAPSIELERRMPPPAELTDYQASIWQQVTATKPADWFQADTNQLLIAYCDHASRKAVLKQQLDTFDPEWLKDEPGMQRYSKLLDMEEKQTRTLSALSRSMRLTQQSRYDHKTAHTTDKKKPTGALPWQG